jgi:hypothetical protein
VPTQFVCSCDEHIRVMTRVGGWGAKGLAAGYAEVAFVGIAESGKKSDGFGGSAEDASITSRSMMGLAARPGRRCCRCALW